MRVVRARVHTDRQAGPDTVGDVRVPAVASVRRGASAVAAGACICFALPPWGWWPLAIVGIAWWSVLNVRPRWQQRFWVGVGVGLGWFLPSNVWMLMFSPVGWPIGVALWFGVVTGVASALCPPNRWGPAGLAATIVASEWIRLHAPFGGVPMSLVAVTQARGPLLPFARIGGPLAISLAVGLAGAALAWITDAAITRDIRRAGPALLSVGLLAAGLTGVVLAPRAHDVRRIEAAAVQGGGQQQTRSYATDYNEVLRRHLDASAEIRTPVDLVVWPENVVNVDSWRGSYPYQQISALARELHATVVVGVVESADAKHFYNEAVAFDPDGRQVARYDKVRRVPFGEYVPMRWLLDPITRGWVYLPPRDAVPGTGPAVLRTRLGVLGVAVSWEVFFPRRIREATRHGAQILLNPTNGSSYWLSQVQTQQLAMSTLRAVETDRWVVQSAPTGFSAIIDPDGVVVARSGIGEKAVVQAEVALRDGRSWWTAVGNTAVLLLAGGLFSLAWADRLRRRSTDVGGAPADAHGAGSTPQGAEGTSGN